MNLAIKRGLREVTLRGLTSAATLVVVVACASAPGKQDLDVLRLAREADANYQSGRLDVAEKKYQALLIAAPDYATANVRLGAIAYRSGNPQQARLQFELAATKDPKNSQAKYNLAMLDLNEAAALLTDYAALVPQASNRQQIMVLLSRLKEFGAGR